MAFIPSRWRSRAPAAQQTDALANWIERFFEEPFGDGNTPMRGDFVPALNIAEDDKSMTVKVELPGFEEKDIHVNLNGNMLTISGERRWEDEQKDKEWHRVESRYGSFMRSVALPANLKTDQVDAVFSKGILSLTIPKTQPTPANKVKIRSQ